MFVAPFQPTTTYYADSVAGDDTNTGTEAAPFTTIGRITNMSDLPHKTAIHPQRSRPFTETAYYAHSKLRMESYGNDPYPVIECGEIVTDSTKASSPMTYILTDVTGNVLNSGKFAGGNASK
ncbi:hypothetical protein [Deinococcus pimensis]|uniref:hypothetical protein n=1 Tax=Deinococcus pimensis TaxID=309888 RepID=UPI000487EF21|nr:hypothetical protein [Deinococcus pimensis]